VLGPPFFVFVRVVTAAGHAERRVGAAARFLLARRLLPSPARVEAFSMGTPFFRVGCRRVIALEGGGGFVSNTSRRLSPLQGLVLRCTISHAEVLQLAGPCVLQR
jgi:hypothetical protein